MARTRSRFVRPPPRTKIWVGAGVGETTLAASATTLIGTAGAAILALRPFTIFRTRMDVLYRSDQAAVSESPFGTLGLIVVTDNATTVGVTAIPNPSGVSGDQDASWLVWQGLSVSFTFLSSVGFYADSGHHYTIDSKSMRKVGANDDIAIMVDQENAVGSTIVTNGRMLLQLH